MFYSKSTSGFYDTAIHGDRTPADVVEITAEQHAALLEGQSQGKVITADADGFPVLSEAPSPEPLTKDQIESLRLQAYANPVTGSDRYFAEAVRLQAMGATSEEINLSKDMGIARYGEIQAEFPWSIAEGV